MKRQAGFTLIELIAVIVILGILAAVAVPRFVNLSDEAQQASVNAMAANITSASSMNFAVDVSREAGISTDTLIQVDNCNDVGQLLQGGLPDQFAVNAANIADKASRQCRVCFDTNNNNSCGTGERFADSTVIGTRP